MRAVILLPLALTACASTGALPAAEQARLEPIAFFTGESTGTGTIDQLFSRPRPLIVRSIGRPDGRGGLVLTQAIREGSKAERTRTWTMRQVGPGRYAGTLTEAVGPVTVQVQGPRAVIEYRMKDGLAVRQQLALQADGRTLLNRLVVTKWGIRVATVRETILRGD